MSLGARPVLAAVAVAGAVGVMLPYAVLRLGFGPNTSVVATLLGGSLLSALRARSRAGLHAAHVAGVAAGQTAFMGVALVALELLRAHHAELGPRPGSLAVFAWLTASGLLGTLGALPLRHHFLVEERLPFAAGAAAAETILALDDRAPRRRPGLAAAAVVGAIATIARPAGATFGALGLGSGALLGLRVAGSLAVGAIAARALPAQLVPWAASSLMVTAGVVTAAQRVPALVRGLGRCRVAPRLAGLSGLMASAAVALAALCAVDRLALGLPVALTLASVALSAPLLLVGTRVLGETNWAPVLSLATVAQAALGAAVPGCLTATMVGSAVAGAIPNGGQHLMQSLRAAQIVGARPRDTVVAQALGVVVGAAALSLTLRGLVLATAAPPPLAAAWAAFAEVFAGGAALPAGAPRVMLGGALVGSTLALLERRTRERVPSPTALGIGLLIPTGLAIAALAGAAIARTLRSRAPRLAEAHAASLAAGLVVGETVAAGALALLGLVPWS